MNDTQIGIFFILILLLWIIFFIYKIHFNFERVCEKLDYLEKELYKEINFIQETTQHCLTYHDTQNKNYFITIDKRLKKLEKKIEE